MHRQGLIGLLDDYLGRWPGEEAVVERFREFVGSEERCFERDCWAGHVTGSAWLVNAARTHVLLTHHRKLGRWLQLGGHSDGEPDSLQVALREAGEESGLAVEPLSGRIFDLDVHRIPARRADPAHHHFDVRFTLCADAGQDFVVSGESLDLAWVELTDIAAYTREESMLRMRDKWLWGGGALDGAKAVR